MIKKNIIIFFFQIKLKMKENLIYYNDNLDESPHIHHLGLKTILKKAYTNILVCTNQFF